MGESLYSLVFLYTAIKISGGRLGSKTETLHRIKKDGCTVAGGFQNRRHKTAVKKPLIFSLDWRKPLFYGGKI